MSEAQDHINVNLAQQFGLPCPITGDDDTPEPYIRAWPKNGKYYRVVDEIPSKGLLVISVPVKDVLDHYATIDPTKLKNALRSAKNADLIRILESIRDESELEYKDSDTVNCAIYDGVAKTPKAAYNPEASSDASLVATVLQGKDDKFEAALAECAKRGIRFTVKQVKAAETKGRTLPTS